MTTSYSSPSRTSQRDDAPLPGASFGQAVTRFFTRYTTFSGRASRSEYWWVALFNFLVLTVASILAALAGAGRTDEFGNPADPGPFGILVGVLVTLYLLAVLVPSLALNARRLHDAGFSGWLQLVAFVPFIGALAMFVLTLLPSSDAGSRYDS